MSPGHKTVQHEAGRTEKRKNCICKMCTLLDHIAYSVFTELLSYEKVLCTFGTVVLWSMSSCRQTPDAIVCALKPPTASPASPPRRVLSSFDARTCTTSPRASVHWSVSPSSSDRWHISAAPFSIQLLHSSACSPPHHSKYGFRSIGHW